MTPAEHLAEAERLLDLGRQGDPPWWDEQSNYRLQAASVHALIAAAAELGVPHPSAPSGGGQSGA